MSRTHWSLGALALLAPLAACSLPDEPAGREPVVISKLEPIDSLDLLFVIDDSISMADDQAALIAAARASLFPQLAALPYGPPDLHVGVISTDMGTGGAITTATCAGAGDDGALLVPPGGTCAGLTDRFLSDVRQPDGSRLRNYTGSLEDAFSCMADLGADGCGFEQPLASLRRAVDPYNLTNAGFLRPDALLLVVILSDEDDCTVTDEGFFAEPLADLASPLGPRVSFRCFEFGVVCDEPEDRTAGPRTSCRPREASPFVSPLAPLVDALVAAKGGDRSMVMVAGIFGDEQPVSVVLDSDLEDIISLDSQCNLPTGITARPAVRLTSFAREFPARFLLPGICDAGMMKSVAAVGAAASDVLGGGTCLLGAPRLPLDCRATAVAADGATRALPICEGEGCVTIAASADCVATDHHLQAQLDRAALAPGETLHVDCATAR